VGDRAEPRERVAFPLRQPLQRRDEHVLGDVLGEARVADPPEHVLEDRPPVLTERDGDRLVPLPRRVVVAHAGPRTARAL
jgi:hypothetical protein